MIEDVIIDIDSFASVYEITLQAIPNQEFSTTINNEIFNIEVRTFANDRTYITIKKDDVTLCNNANIKIPNMHDNLGISAIYSNT